MENKNNSNNTFGKFIKKNGFYVALVICVMAAAAASLTAVGTILDNLVPEGDGGSVQHAPNLQPDDPEAVQPSEKVEDEVPVEVPVEQPVEEVPVEPAPADEPAANLEPLVPVYRRAVNGQLSWAFSGDELVKSSTMNDWRTHNGADYLAEDGERVTAVFSGEVVRAGEDPLWGNVVEHKLDSGYTVVYAGLKSITVRPGDRLSQGDEVGLAGNTSVLEAADPIHVHIEVRSGDRYLDPEELFRK